MKNSLSRFLKEKNMTQADLAKKLRVSRSLISFYLSGQRQPGREMARRISNLTGIPVLELLYPETKKG